MKANWKSIPMQAGLSVRVPAFSGLYAILRAPKLHGLPVEWEIAYVGKTLNLRRRFREHAIPWRERSRTLRGSSIYRDPDWEFWYRELEPAQLDRGEQDLIRRVRPALNLMLYGGN
jgi:excinuclease UvrABC nuclease subunit